jgi:hypothetical protein
MYFIYAFPCFTQGTRKIVNQASVVSVNQASAVSIVPCHGLHKPGFESWQEQEDFSLLQNAPTGSGAHPAFHTIATGFIFGGGEG